MTLIPPLIIIIIVLLFVSAFFSASETALIALSKIRLRHLMNKGIKNAQLIHRLVTNIDKLIATILVGNNFVNIAISAISTALFIYLLGPKWGIIIATIVITTLILIFGEIIPKILAAQYSEKISLSVARPMQFIIKLLNPLTKIFTKVSNFVIRIFTGKTFKRSPLITEEEIRLMIEVGKEEGVLADEERKMLHRIFEFGDTKVSEVMVPKEKIVAININAKPEELLDLLVEEGHSRIAVYQNTIDDIIGIIYARELLHIWRNRELIIISDLIHSPYFISRDKRVNDLLREFQQKRIHIAIIVDENRKTQGLITLEDLLEEIVGEIEEEKV